MADNSNANVDLWLYGGDINNRVDTDPSAPKTKTKPVNPVMSNEIRDLVNAGANIVRVIPLVVRLCVCDGCVCVCVSVCLCVSVCVCVCVDWLVFLAFPFLVVGCPRSLR